MRLQLGLASLAPQPRWHLHNMYRKYKTGSGATACIDMTYKTCAQGREFSSTSAGADKEGATSNDGKCLMCRKSKVFTGTGSCIDMSQAETTCGAGVLFKSIALSGAYLVPDK